MMSISISFGKFSIYNHKYSQCPSKNEVSNLQYQSKILRQKVKKIETKSQKNWDKKSKKLRQIFSFNNIKNYKLIWNFLSFIFNALCKPIWKWFNHIWYCFIFNFIVCIFISIINSGFLLISFFISWDFINP